jgi:phosphoglycolate phosphatase-like HAD superfamily hydrolase
MAIKAIIFDFDGVIVESMDLKTQAFIHLFGSYPEGILKKVVKLHLDNGGMSRYEKFRIIYKDYLKKDLSDVEEKRLCADFSKFCFEKMLECPYVNGAEEFIKNNFSKYMFFIVSGTPDEEINRIVDKRGLRKYFKGVWGTPGKKGELTKMILKNYNLKNNEVAFIGDAPTDYISAQEAKVNFIARINPAEYNPFESSEFNLDYSIDDLFSLEGLLSKGNF